MGYVWGFVLVYQPVINTNTIHSMSSSHDLSVRSTLTSTSFPSSPLSSSSEVTIIRLTAQEFSSSNHLPLMECHVPPSLLNRHFLPLLLLLQHFHPPLS